MTRKSLIVAAFVALVWAAPANAHLVAKPRCGSLHCRLASQSENLKHARYVCHHGANRPKRWNCAAVRWLTKELRKTKAALSPPPVRKLMASTGYTGLSAIKYAVAFCESGGNPYNSNNPKYRGKWQFDQSTWDAYAPTEYRGQDPATVPESIQDQTALRVTYDAWPNC